ncbi:MAG TPA: CRISPR system precrRNA processing endoribonuclease RAMP protein Cas6 [Clostridia bacterium]|nr:CRISPR system precrRNA processing endoribonuclease RAMP protein Cas6 [Clostridia bacterium]
MLSSVIQIDIKTEEELKSSFVGSIFRGWLGFVLKCDPEISCSGCDKTSKCPYFMVFKEQNSIKPYSLLAFKNKGDLSCFIKLHGERRKFAPQILSEIKRKEKETHFGGLGYRIESIKARNTEVRSLKLGDKTRIVTTSPLHLSRNHTFEVIPSFNTILRSCIRSYNRVTKFYDPESYPFHVPENTINFDTDILDFDVNTVEYEHINMYKKGIQLTGIEGWIEYDTSEVPVETGNILGMGELLQIGKRTAYGLGGFTTVGKVEKND